MLADLGCSYVILGHSERRGEHGENDAQVRGKAEAALAAGLVPIVCVGETEEERLAGQALAVIARQVKGSVPAGMDGERLVVTLSSAAGAEPRLVDRSSLESTGILVVDRRGQAIFETAGFMPDWMPPWP